MAHFELEGTEHQQDTGIRNTTHIEELEAYLRSVGHPEVEQHRQAVRSLGSRAVEEEVYSD